MEQPIVPENLTIHGTAYLADAKASKKKKTFWLIMMFCSIIGFTYCAYRLIMGYIDPQIGIKINTVPASSLPFPAITICPQMKFEVNNYNFTELYNKACKGNFNYSSIDEQKLFEMAMQTCDESRVTLVLLQATDKFDLKAELSGHETIDFIEKMNSETFEVLAYFNGNSSFLHSVFTEEGLCYSFNFEDYSTVFKEGVLHKDFDRFK
jgi:acid-sensing ion channel, other